MSFKEQLKALLKSLGLSQAKAADYLGVPKRSFENWCAVTNSMESPNHFQHMVIYLLKNYNPDLKYFDCIHEKSDCEICSLCSYGKDCHNKEI